MQHRDLGRLTLVQAKGALSHSVESLLPAFLAALPSVAPCGCGAGVQLGRRNEPRSTHYTPQSRSALQMEGPDSAALVGLTRLSPPLLLGEQLKSPLHSQTSEEGPPQAPAEQPEWKGPAEPEEDSAGSPIPPVSLQR